MASLTTGQIGLLVAFGFFAAALGGAAFHLRLHHKRNGERSARETVSLTPQLLEDHREEDIDWDRVPG
ncbi:MAG: hypothetical protein Q8P88_03145 [Candidatus Jorgensenbacteria bacterium]|nr:hypothetical protein [Candidatus Jorgensenbacteria bacterium]